MIGRIGFWIARLRERLWVRPLAFSLLSMTGVFLAKAADSLNIDAFVPAISSESIETLLSIVAASMLVVATFAVGSMVSAYASASSAATPRSFPVVVADDVSQNALSTFIGAFIFSIMALIAMQNDYYANAGNFALFVLTILVFALVVLTFVRWVDRIARLGRLGTTVDAIERAAAAALQRRRASPALGGLPAGFSAESAGVAVYGVQTGYVQHLDVAALQKCAEQHSVQIAVHALPGTLATPGRPLAYIIGSDKDSENIDTSVFAAAFKVGGDRTFEQDPRFGLIALSEIAARALSPAVNDPGTAIDIIGTFLRLFVAWAEPLDDGKPAAEPCALVQVPTLSVRDMFDDAFTAIARDGAGIVEVHVRLQKALKSLASIGDSSMQEAARWHSRLALARAENALSLTEDIELLRTAANWST